MATKAKKPAPATEPRAFAEEVSEPARTVDAAAPTQRQALFPRLDYETLAGIGREQVAAVVASNQALFSGLESIGKELIDLTGTALETVHRTAEALLGARTIDDIVALNTALARTQAERLLLRSAKLSELSAAVTKEAWAPLGGALDAMLATLTRRQAA